MTKEVCLIDMNSLWECETCFHHKQNGCDTWCDIGESYRPAASKLKVIDPESLRPTGRWEQYADFWRKCSICGGTWHEQWIMSKQLNYCPNCGAKMMEG